MPPLPPPPRIGRKSRQHQGNEVWGSLYPSSRAGRHPQPWGEWVARRLLPGGEGARWPSAMLIPVLRHGDTIKPICHHLKWLPYSHACVNVLPPGPEQISPDREPCHPHPPCTLWTSCCSLCLRPPSGLSWLDPAPQTKLLMGHVSWLYLFPLQT